MALGRLVCSVTLSANQYIGIKKMENGNRSSCMVDRCSNDFLFKCTPFQLFSCNLFYRWLIFSEYSKLIPSLIERLFVNKTGKEICNKLIFIDTKIFILNHYNLGMQIFYQPVLNIIGFFMFFVARP